MAEIKRGDLRPPYAQIADDLRRMVLTGEVSPGERLESGRTLADRYGVAPMTIQRAIQQLKAEGLLATWQGRGVFVAEELPESDDRTNDSDARLDRLEEAVRQLSGRVEALEERTRP